MKKRKRGRPSGVYIVDPEGEVINTYADYHHRYEYIIEYIEDRPKTFRRRRTRSGRRVTSVEPCLEYIERLIPTVQDLCKELYGYPRMPPAAARAIIAASVPPEGSSKGDVNKKGVAQLILLYYHGDGLKHPTLKAIRDRVKKGKTGRPLTPAELETLAGKVTSRELIEEATRFPTTPSQE